MTKSTFEDILQNGDILYYTNVGDSMMPLIEQGRDLLMISPKPKGRLEVDDVPLYKRDSGQYVLHRIIKVFPDDYGIRGDNRYGLERGISDRHIIGILTGIIRDGKTITISDPEYLAYVDQLHKNYPRRYLVYLAQRILRRLSKCLKP